MADKKISQLVAVSAASDGHEFAVNEEGVSKKISMGQIKTGPFRVRRALDSTSYIEIDPDNARILAAVDARPTRVLSTSFVRTYLSGGAGTIGSVMAARSINNGLTGGFFTGPLRIPEDMDVSEPTDVIVLLSPIHSATVNGQVISLGLSYSRVTAAGTNNNGVLTFNWPVPDNWMVNNFAFVVIDNGNGRTFEADVFSPGDFLGLQLARLGGAAEDTFNKGLYITETIGFRHRTKQF